jgi:hypothetical protein
LTNILNTEQQRVQLSKNKLQSLTRRGVGASITAGVIRDGVFTQRNDVHGINQMIKEKQQSSSDIGLITSEI